MKPTRHQPLTLLSHQPDTFNEDAVSARRGKPFFTVGVILLLGPLCTACGVLTVAGAAAGAVISVTGAVVSAGVGVAGTVIESGVDLVTPGDDDDDEANKEKSPAHSEPALE